MEKVFWDLSVCGRKILQKCLLECLSVCADEIFQKCLLECRRSIKT